MLWGAEPKRRAWCSQRQGLGVARGAVLRAHAARARELTAFSGTNMLRYRQSSLTLGDEGVLMPGCQQLALQTQTV